MNVKLNGNGIFKVTSKFGEIDSVHPTSHTGIDLGIKCNTPLYSPTDGVVERITEYGSQSIGKGIIIKTEDGDHLILGHLSDTSSVHVGQHIDKGDFLGLTGTTGSSTGCHLHLGLRDGETNQFINPSRFFNENNLATKPIPNNHTTQISDAAHDIAPQVTTMDAGELLQNALSQFADTLSQMSLNVIHFIFNSSTFDLILETICVMFGV